jgi:hypothetical protein
VPGEFIRRHRPDLPPFTIVAEGARADLLLVADNTIWPGVLYQLPWSLETIRYPLRALLMGSSSNVPTARGD